MAAFWSAPLPSSAITFPTPKRSCTTSFPTTNDKGSPLLAGFAAALMALSFCNCFDVGDVFMGPSAGNFEEAVWGVGVSPKMEAFKKGLKA